MPIFHHKKTHGRFFFIHIPRTAGRFLIENFKAQTYPKQLIEWIVIDDGEDNVADLFESDPENTEETGIAAPILIVTIIPATAARKPDNI